MRTIEDTFKNADFLQPKVYNRYKLGKREEIKEMFIKAFEYYDKTIDEYNHLPAYDEIIDWMVDTRGRGLMLMVVSMLILMLLRKLFLPLLKP